MASGFLSAAMGGIGGAADAAQRQARGHIEDERKLDLTKQLSALEEQRELRLMEARERAGFAGKKRDIEELTPLRQEAERKGKQAEFEQDMGNAPRKTAAEVEAAKARRRAEGDVDREQVVAQGTDKKYLGAVRAKRQAEHIESAGSAASAEATRMDTASKRQMLQLRTALADQLARGDEQGAAATRRRIDALGYTPTAKNTVDYDLEEVTTETDPLGGPPIEKRKRIEKRRPDPTRPSSTGATAPAAPAANRPPLDSFFRK